jgi:hypothetical protein
MDGTLSKLSDRALELIMRDVLAGMAELALQSTQGKQTEQGRIVSIKPASRPPPNNQHEQDAGSRIVSFSRYQKTLRP